MYFYPESVSSTLETAADEFQIALLLSNEEIEKQKNDVQEIMINATLFLYSEDSPCQ